MWGKKELSVPFRRLLWSLGQRAANRHRSCPWTRRNPRPLKGNTSSSSFPLSLLFSFCLDMLVCMSFCFFPRASSTTTIPLSTSMFCLLSVSLSVSVSVPSALVPSIVWVTQQGEKRNGLLLHGSVTFQQSVLFCMHIWACTVHNTSRSHTHCCRQMHELTLPSEAVTFPIRTVTTIHAHTNTRSLFVVLELRAYTARVSTHVNISTASSSSNASQQQCETTDNHMTHLSA